MPIASLGHGAMQAPQPVQLSVSTAGRNGPPRRGRIEIAASGQASRQVMQVMPAMARQSPEIATMCAMIRGSEKTGSGQAFAHSPQKVHSPAKGSSVTLPASSARIFSGQAATHAPQPVQAATEAIVTPGGRGWNGMGAGLPRRSWRRDMLAAARISGQCPIGGGPGGPANIW